MLEFDFDKMLFTLPADKHGYEDVREIIKSHPEVHFASLVGIDIGGNDTDEKIPISLFLEDMEKFLENGVQTDGSSVVLPKIANLNNAKVDIIPDVNADWHVDYNYNHIDYKTGLPVGTLRIPAFLRHNDTADVGARVILRDAAVNFKKDLVQLLKDNPYVYDYLPIDDADEIDEIVLTCATELEFWVKTPDDEADFESLSTAQQMKEQYWKRTIGPVRTALEKSLYILDKYGFEIEMGHKEVGGVTAKMDNAGHYDHVMEQLEIDWKFTNEMQAADNERMVKYVVRDIFRQHGLDVTFAAKPIEGVAGSGEHTHVGVSAKLKSGKMINLFSAKDSEKDFLSPIGFGALLGILKNYEVINPFVSHTNDAFNRLRPGFEAPVCIVTSLGHSIEMPSRNRTVLLGLIRDMHSSMATRFELRSPNPKSNTYLVIAACYMAMLDGIKYALNSKKTEEELLKELSKKQGEEFGYLEKDREYRSEKDVFEDYTEEERNSLFGKAPKSVIENIENLDSQKAKLEILKVNNVFKEKIINSFKMSVIKRWREELTKRIITEYTNEIRSYKAIHIPEKALDNDLSAWTKINEIRKNLAKDSTHYECLFTRIKKAIKDEDYKLASDLSIELEEKIETLRKMYYEYTKNILDF